MIENQPHDLHILFHSPSIAFAFALSISYHRYDFVRFEHSETINKCAMTPTCSTIYMNCIHFQQSYLISFQSMYFLLHSPISFNQLSFCLLCQNTMSSNNAQEIVHKTNHSMANCTLPTNKHAFLPSLSFFCAQSCMQTTFNFIKFELVWLGLNWLDFMLMSYYFISLFTTNFFFNLYVICLSIAIWYFVWNQYKNKPK